MKTIVLNGASVKLYINNALYKEVQEISYQIDYGVKEIYGIDSPFPQEVVPTRVAVQGAISGIRIKNSGGITAYDAVAPISKILSSPYISIRITDRSTKEDILFVQSAMVTSQSFAVGARNTARVSFTFKGMVPYGPLDRS